MLYDQLVFPCELAHSKVPQAIFELFNNPGIYPR